MTRIQKKIKIEGAIEVLSGLHIGATNPEFEIAGIKGLVIRNPKDNLPLIPGSSLKGKLRSLLELANGTISPNGTCSTDINSDSGFLFGVPVKDETGSPSRIIVRDAVLDKDTVDLDKTERYYTEVKTEISINRITSSSGKSLRQFERIPAGARFKFEFIINYFVEKQEDGIQAPEKQEDEKSRAVRILTKAMRLLENDYLGGCGSRGYGKIRFVDCWEADKKTLKVTDIN